MLLWHVNPRVLATLVPAVIIKLDDFIVLFILRIHHPKKNQVRFKREAEKEILYHYQKILGSVTDNSKILSIFASLFLSGGKTTESLKT